MAIGIDFGTRYTKIAYNVGGGGARRLVRSNGGNPLFQSRLFLDGQERVWFGPAPEASDSPRREISYLKMLVCSPALGGILGLEDLVRPDPIGLDALAAFYLSLLVRWTRRVVMTAEHVQARGDTITWSTALSVPAQYHDGKTQERFRRIADVAHNWAYAGMPEGRTWTELTTAFKKASEGPLSHRVSVIPEIVAGLHHVIGSPDTVAGIHGFVDIGGGTVDGAIFRIVEIDGRRQVNVLSTAVARLGSAIVSHRALLGVHSKAERLLMGDNSGGIALDFDVNRKELLTFANSLLGQAAARNSFGVLHDDPWGARNRELSKDARKEFRINVAGGGAHSTWYLDTISAAERNVNHAVYSAMPFAIGCLPTPEGYDEPGSAFERFAVAWNLASDPKDLEALKALMPSELDVASDMTERPFEPIDHKAIYG